MRCIVSAVSIGWISAILLASTAGNAGAQRAPIAVRISDAVSCARCELIFQPTAILIAPHDTTDGFPDAVRIDLQGRYWVFRRGDVPALFDSRGKFVRTLGRLGRGPGEFQMAYDLLVVGGDSLVVLDAGNRRATVLTPSLTPVRYATLPFYMMSPILVSWPNTVISGGTFPTPDGTGRQLHRTSLAGKEGALVKSFGPGDGELRGPEEMYLVYQTLAQARNGVFWSIGNYSYDLFQWKADGSLIRAIQRRPPWFSKPSPMNYNWKTEPPPPHIAAIEEDREGLLWVFIRIAASTWKQAWPVVPEAVREVPSRLIAKDKLYATTVEIIDPRTRRVVARQTFDRYVVGSMPDRRVAFYEVDSNGESRIVIGTLALAGR